MFVCAIQMTCWFCFSRDTLLLACVKRRHRRSKRHLSLHVYRYSSLACQVTTVNEPPNPTDIDQTLQRVSDNDPTLTKVNLNNIKVHVVDSIVHVFLFVGEPLPRRLWSFRSNHLYTKYPQLFNLLRRSGFNGSVLFRCLVLCSLVISPKLTLIFEFAVSVAILWFPVERCMRADIELDQFFFAFRSTYRSTPYRSTPRKWK